MAWGSELFKRRRKTGTSVILAVVIAAVPVVPVAGFVLINEFGRRECPLHQKKIAAELYNLISARVTANASPDGPGVCDGDDPAPQVVAAFDGPITEADVVAAYRRHAAEVGWREGMALGTSWLCFDGALTDGTPFKVEVWSDKPETGGTIPQYFVTGSYPNEPTSVTARCGNQ
jgi:hypothetical protein